MAKRRPQTRVTKKHLARAERERLQRRWILLGSATVVIIIISLLIAGWVDLNIVPVATINGEDISTASFRGRIRLYEAEMINQMIYQGQTDLIAQRLEYRDIIGQEVLDQITEDVLIRQEVERRGIKVTKEDIDRIIAESFGYYPEGTPTRIPTSTPDPTDVALASITPTITEGPSPTPSPTNTPGPSPTLTPTRTPFPTSTLVTEEGYLENFKLSMTNLKDLFGITERDFREQYRALIYRQKLYESFESEVPREQEQVHARHILLDTEETALLVLRLLEEGVNWDELASEYSTDVTNKDRGGDLGWFPRGQMIEPFEDAAFTADVGKVVGPVETDEGWHIIEVLDKGLRALDEYNYQLSVQDAYNDWITTAVSEADVKIRSNWEKKLPPQPNLQKILSP